MQHKIESYLLKVLDAKEVEEVETIQSLWGGYGKIVRIAVKGIDSINSVVLKHIILPNNQHHPRGWNTNLSHQRKLKSYQVEMYWYDKWADRCSTNCRVAICYEVTSINGEHIILLEDLDAVGFSVRKTQLQLKEVKVCLKWLANFHATFLNEKPNGLWEVGTYWNLATRPDEFAAMQNKPLKQAAHQINEVLNNCKYKTIVHGDAKVANFCFSEDGKNVAAVDFQYVGGGCGMKDVVYLLGSCLDEESCEFFEQELLTCYFLELKKAVTQHHKEITFEALEKEWRNLFAIAWTDFSRFLDGWMPHHHKNNNYTKQLEKETLELTTSTRKFF